MKCCNFILIIFIVLFLQGCASKSASTVIDGSTPSTTEASVDAIMLHLSDANQLKFVIALTSIRFFESNSLLNSTIIPLDYSILSKRIDGLNYTEIMKLAKKSESNIVYF